MNGSNEGQGGGGGLRGEAVPNRRMGKELEVMRLIARGMTDDAVARRLGVSVATVRRRIRRFRTRLGATSRIQAAVEACHRGWL